MQLRYPACLLEEASISCCLAAQPVHLLGSSSDVVAAALAAGSIATTLCHQREAAEMAAEGLGAAAATPGLTAVCLVASPDGASYQQAAASPASSALLRALRRRVPGVSAITVASSSLLDDEWLGLGRADVILLDLPLPSDEDCSPTEDGTAAAAAAAGPAADTAAQQEQHIAAVHRQLEAAGLLELVWQRFWAGCRLVGVGQGCALLGRGPDPEAVGSTAAPPVLPWYCLRAGGGGTGWAALHAALTQQAHPPSPLLGVGVLAGGCWVADPATGHAELLAAPSRDALVATAAWTAQPGNQLAERGLGEADEGDYGFFCELNAAGE